MKAKEIILYSLEVTGQNKGSVTRNEETGEWLSDDDLDVVDVAKTLDNLGLKIQCDGNCDSCKLTIHNLCDLELNLITKEILVGDISEIVDYYHLYYKIFKQ